MHESIDIAELEDEISELVNQLDTINSDNATLKIQIQQLKDENDELMAVTIILITLLILSFITLLNSKGLT